MVRLPGARQKLSSLFSAVIPGIVTFAATNVDDLFILRLFFSQTDAAFP
jgi:cadmium resistance protein CadD (predicted permease)